MDCIAHIVHNSTGRLRLRVPSMRGDTAYFEYVANAIMDLAGTRDVQVNATSASILLIHDGIRPEDVQDFASHEDLFDLQMPDTDLGPAGPVSMQSLKTQLLNVGTTSSKTAFFYLLLALAVRQLIKGHVMAPAISMIWYAMQIMDEGNNKK